MKTITLCAVFIVSLFGIAFTEDRMWAPLADKTLVVWTAPANLKQAGGSALTIDDRDSHFDAIVFWLNYLPKNGWLAATRSNERRSNRTITKSRRPIPKLAFRWALFIGIRQ